MRKLIKRYLSGGNTGNVGANLLIDIKPIAGLTSPLLNNTNLLFSLGLQDKLSSIEPSIDHKGNFLGKLLKGNNGLYSMAGNVLTSLLPERITSSGIDTVNNVLSMAENIPVYGKFATLAKFGINAIDSLGGSTLDSLSNDLDTQDALAMGGSGYGGFMTEWNDAKSYSGKRAGLFSDRSGMNSKIHEANYNMLKLQSIIGGLKNNNLLTALMEDRWNERTMMDMNGGVGNISFGRLGLKIEILPKVHAILNAPKVVATLTEFEEVPEFKEGGKMNVIPEGALHARLHHMENADGLTKKGIPVVSISERGELEQQAEIELNEIIFNLEVTLKLEKLMQDGSDNAAIEAGKLLVKEIFENTDDRTGLIKDLEPEKKELTPEEAVKNHQLFKEGGNINKSNKTIDELVEEAIKLNPFFVLRIGPDMGYAEFVDKEGKTVRGTHYLETSTDDRGRYIVSPRIQMKNGRLQDLGDKAWEEAKRNKNYLVFESPEDAELFVTQYKNSKKWKPFFDIWERRYGSYKNGGIIERLNTLSPEQLDKLNEFLNGMLA